MEFITCSVQPPWYVVANLYHILLTDELESSFKHAAMADLCLSCGSSLTVTPAADIPTVLYGNQ